LEDLVYVFEYADREHKFQELKRGRGGGLA